MHGIAVALLTEDREQLSVLEKRLEETHLGRIVFNQVGFPSGPTDTVLRQLQDSRAEVVVIDIAPKDAQRAIRTIELIRATTQQIAIFAHGEMSQPANIVASMRAGAARVMMAISSSVYSRSRSFSTDRCNTRGSTRFSTS